MTGGVYTRGSSRYSIVATDAQIQHRGRVAVFYWPSPQYAVEAIQNFGNNVVGFQLATGERKCRNMVVQEPRNNLDHYLYLGFLHIAPLREHTEYLRWRTQIPLRPPDTPTREDGIFADLRRAIPKPKSQEANKNAWISAET